MQFSCHLCELMCGLRLAIYRWEDKCGWFYTGKSYAVEQKKRFRSLPGQPHHPRLQPIRDMDRLHESHHHLIRAGTFNARVTTATRLRPHDFVTRVTKYDRFNTSPARRLSISTVERNSRGVWSRSRRSCNRCLMQRFCHLFGHGCTFELS